VNALAQGGNKKIMEGNFAEEDAGSSAGRFWKNLETIAAFLLTPCTGLPCKLQPHIFNHPLYAIVPARSSSGRL
jgi:hypothetical protein